MAQRARNVPKHSVPGSTKSDKATPKLPEKRPSTNFAREVRERRSLPAGITTTAKETKNVTTEVKSSDSSSLRNRWRQRIDAPTVSSQGKENRKFLSHNRNKTGPNSKSAKSSVLRSKSSEHISNSLSEVNQDPNATGDSADGVFKHRSSDNSLTINLFDAFKKKIASTHRQIGTYSRQLIQELLLTPYTRPFASVPADLSNLDTTGEQIELSHFDSATHSDTLGVGHRFVTEHLKSATWCDKCGDFIWGLNKECLKCQYCGFTCHHKCRQLTTVDCPNPKEGTSVDSHQRTLSSSAETSLTDSLERNASVKLRKEDENTDSGYCTGESIKKSIRSEITAQIRPFNLDVSSSTLPTDGSTFQGFIRVNMNLSRPINMSIGGRPPSIYEVLSHETDEHVDRDNVTSFYLPKDTIRAIHISSETTSYEVIEMLLRKFKITDNPRKFALFEQTIENKCEFKMKKLEADEKPLAICVKWSQDSLKKKRFMLQENDTGEILWDDFSLPELFNFMRILEKEEQDYEKELREKYKLQKIRIQERLKEIKNECMGATSVA